MSLSLQQDTKARDAYADGGLEKLLECVGSEDFLGETVIESMQAGYEMAIKGMETMLGELGQDFPL